LLNKTTYKRSLSILLVLVFFSPTLIKAAHILYTEHQHEFISNSNTIEINESHSDCPICVFEFTQIIASENYYEITHQQLVSDFTPFFTSPILKTSALLSFNLRAPPVNSSL